MDLSTLRIPYTVLFNQPAVLHRHRLSSLSSCAGWRKMMTLPDAFCRIYAPPRRCWFMYVFGCLGWTFEHSITNCLALKLMHANKSRLMKMRNIIFHSVRSFGACLPVPVLILLLWCFDNSIKQNLNSSEDKRAFIWIWEHICTCCVNALSSAHWEPGPSLWVVINENIKSKNFPAQPQTGMSRP